MGESAGSVVAAEAAHAVDASGAEAPAEVPAAAESIVEELRDRAAQYQALASFFLDLPSVAGVQSVADGLADAGATNCDCSGEADEASEARAETADGRATGEVSPGLQELAAFFAGVEVGEALVEQIAADRTFLVRGITKRGPRPPYGLVHAGSDPAVSMVKLKQRYREAGFVFGKNTGEAPDYLGVMLAFMASVLERAAENADECEVLLAASDEFLRLYVAPTVRSYNAEALDAADTGYCRGMLMMLDEFIAAEAAAAAAAAI